VLIAADVRAYICREPVDMRKSTDTLRTRARAARTRRARDGSCRAHRSRWRRPAVEKRNKRRVPFTPLVSLINGLTLRAVNELYCRKQRKPIEISSLGGRGFLSVRQPARMEPNLRAVGVSAISVRRADGARDAVRAMLDRFHRAARVRFSRCSSVVGTFRRRGCCRF